MNSIEERKAISRRWFEEGWGGNVAVFDELGEGEWMLEMSLAAQIEAFHTGFPDLKVSVEEQVAEGDKVVTRIHFTGTHTGDLLGIGSLQIQAASPDPIRQAARQRQADDANMIVPIDLLKPIFEDLATIGRPNRPARPWLGLYATEIGSSVALLGTADRAPAEQAGLREGDIVLAVAGDTVSSLAELFRRIWALGEAGVAVPLTVNREGRTFEVNVRSTDRRGLLKGPVIH